MLRNGQLNGDHAVWFFYTSATSVNNFMEQSQKNLPDDVVWKIWRFQSKVEEEAAGEEEKERKQQR